MNRILLIGTIILASGIAARLKAGQQGASSGPALPAGVRAVWDLDKAYRENTPTRERVCLNGLWRWQPADASGADAVPAERWGYFKVPGCWPGITDYMQKDSQTVFSHPAWAAATLRDLTTAWYQREITVPAGWKGRRIALQAECVNSLAVVYVDGKRVGEIRFPAGEVDLTPVCSRGGRHLLSTRVVAMPLRAVMLSHADTNAPREARGTVARRGLCGDVFLAGTPAGARIADVRIQTSVRQGEITVEAGLEQLGAGARYTLRAEVWESVGPMAGRPGTRRGVQQFTSKVFTAGDLKDGRVAFAAKWKPGKLWDLHTPGNMYEAQVSLIGSLSGASPAVRPSLRDLGAELRPDPTSELVGYSRVVPTGRGVAAPSAGQVLQGRGVAAPPASQVPAGRTAAHLPGEAPTGVRPSLRDLGAELRPDPTSELVGYSRVVPTGRGVAAPSAGQVLQGRGVAAPPTGQVPTGRGVAAPPAPHVPTGRGVATEEGRPGLRTAAGKRALDTAYPVRFGFREFRIEGRDFFLNGSRIFLCALPVDNAAIGAALANYAAARETLERLKSFGINFVYTHNYGCEPGSHLSFEELLRAADDVGMLVALSQPHFSQYDWQAPDAEQTNGYARHAAFYARVAGDHPSVAAYAMSHNATGYGEDMNPDMIDGIRDPRSSPGELRNAASALRAEAIVRRLDPGRIVYHHSSGNLGAMHTVNFYANFVPVQELSDWFEHWATQGVKPVFLCEYGVPFSWDWGMYRGWYNGQREFGSAVVPWEFCLAEWNAQFLGDQAYQITPMEQRNLRWEAQQFRAGRVWHRWDYPTALGSSAFAERDPVFAMYLTDNWRAFRTWGVSAISPWEYGVFWRAREGVNRGRKEFAVDWERLQRPGFSPDYMEDRFERMDVAFERSDWVPTAAGQALLRGNRPLLAYIGGKPSGITSKDHIFLPGEVVEKQLIVINNSRATVACDCQWSLDLPQPIAGSKRLTVRTGEQERTPLRFDLPAALAAGTYMMRAAFRFNNGETQQDAFSIHVLPPSSPPTVAAKIALFDPRGETARLLDALRVPYQRVEAKNDLAPYDVLIVGKAALTRDGPGPDLERVRDGLKVIVFEQTAEVMEQRLGFRVAEYGLRRVFPRVPGHPLLSGLGTEDLRDWRGEATILPPRLQYTLRPRYGPTVKWCDIDVTRIWRCGCRGSVASMLIEKPARGDFLPVLDGGYSLQFSPLLEYREGKGMVLFCQLDVTGRTEGDPAAARLARNLLGYVAAWKPGVPSGPRRQAVYVGDPAGRRYLEAAGVPLAPGGDERLAADRILIVGAGGGQRLGGRAAEIRSWLNAGGRLLALGLEEADVSAFLGSGGTPPVRMKRAEHIAAFFEPPGGESPMAGIGPADVHNRDPRDFPLLTGTEAVGDGILGTALNRHVVFCQLAPWQFDRTRPMNQKRTFRRAAFLLSRLLGNMGVGASTPVLSRFGSPAAGGDKRWLEGLYLDTPEEWDDPYRFFRW